MTPHSVKPPWQGVRLSASTHPAFRKSGLPLCCSHPALAGCAPQYAAARDRLRQRHARRAGADPPRPVQVVELPSRCRFPAS
jgi:hypothetical protein